MASAGTRVRVGLAGLLVVSALAVAFSASARAASIWSPVTSGTAQTITAIAASSSAEVLYATAGGELHYLNASGGFAPATESPPDTMGFSDIATSADGNHAVAVGAGGAIYYSADSGRDWVSLASTPSTTPIEYSGSCGAGSTAPLADAMYSARFASAATVYVTGANNDILKSTDGGQHFSEVNKNPSSQTCIVNDVVGDTAWTSATAGVLLSNSFGHYYATTDGLGGSVGATTQLGSAVNGSQGGDRLALDLADPHHAWAIDPNTGPSHFQATADSGATWATPTLADGSTTATFADIANVGLTVVAAGGSGAIYTSADGVSFGPQPAPAPLNATAWSAVAMIPGTATAFVGGAGGALVETTQANTPPTTPTPIATPVPIAPVAPAPIPPKTVKPKLANVALSGSRLLFTASAKGTISLTVARRETGHKHGGKCSTTAHHGKTCTVYKTVFHVTRSVSAGAGHLTFGRSSLRKGTYRASLTLTVGRTKSATATRLFKVS